VADPFGLHLSRPSRAVSRRFTPPAPAADPEGYKAALIEIAASEAVDLVIPVSEEVMHVSGLAPDLPAHTRLLAPEPTTLLALHDKYAFARQADEAGLRAPESWLGDSPEAQGLASRADTIAKPRFGCSGAGLKRLKAGDTLPEAVRNKAWVIQRCISGDEVSTLSFCREGRVLGHVVYRGLILSGTVAVAFERIDRPAVDDWVSDFAASTGHTGFIAFDFMLDAHATPWPLECNPRLTSGIHFMNAEDLAAVVTNQPLDAPFRLKPGRRFQEGHTALTMAYGKILRPRTYWETLKIIASSRDVLWSSRDPWVFPLMTPMSWPVLYQALFKGRSLGQAATFDIEWQADEATLNQPAPSPHRAPQQAQAS
jgi:hypothetical protein